MKTLIELYFYLSPEEKEILMFEYKDEMAIKFALSRLLQKEVSKHCELITCTDKWFYRDSVFEKDESETTEEA